MEPCRLVEETESEMEAESGMCPSALGACTASSIYFVGSLINECMKMCPSVEYILDWCVMMKTRMYKYTELVLT